MKEEWDTIYFGGVKFVAKSNQYMYEVQVYLNDLSPKAVRVELYADGVNGASPVRQEMEILQPLADSKGGYVYSAVVPATRPAADYTARVIPYFPGVAVPLEEAHILWQK